MPSLMNGLSAAGAAISSFANSAGLEQQKMELANKAQILANQLATTRETTLQGQQQQFQTGLQAQSQAFQSGQTAKEIAARASEGALTRAEETSLEYQREHAPTDTEKLFNFLKINPDGTPMAGSAPSTPSGVGGGGGAGTAATMPTQGTSGTGGGAPSPTSQSAPAVTTASSGGTSAPALSATGTSASQASNQMPDFARAIISKAIGLGAPGSEQADRAAIASGVSSDPAFRNATREQQGEEIERRWAVATAKIADAPTRDVLATAISGYQLPPLTLNRSNPGSYETMAGVMQKNPNYQAEQYNVMSDAMKKFAGGPDGDKIRFNDVGVQHLAVLDQTAQALENNDFNPINRLKNYIATEFGAAPPNSFDAMKGLVAKEVQRAVTGGLGAVQERQDLESTLSNARSTPQLLDVTSRLRSLMLGQLNGLRQQYNQATLNQFKEGSPFAFENKLLPETKAALGLVTATTHAAAPTTIEAAPTDPADRKMGQSYRVPDGRVLPWGGTGWQPPPDTGMGAGAALTLGLTP